MVTQNPITQQGFGPAICSQKLYFLYYKTERAITGSTAQLQILFSWYWQNKRKNYSQKFSSIPFKRKEIMRYSAVLIQLRTELYEANTTMCVHMCIF